MLKTNALAKLRAPILLLSACSLVACHHGASGDMTPTSTHGPGVVSSVPYPAFSPDVPQVITGGGPVMDAPQAVAITFPDDALVDDIEKFTATLGGTRYWATTTAEYGVGPLAALPPVRLTEAAPASITDDGIQAWLVGKLDGTHPELPPATANTLYLLYYPESTSVDQGGAKSCDAFLGYHNSTTLTDGTPVIYAVIPRCSGTGFTLLQDVTVTASHESIEAVTDPQFVYSPAYFTVDDNHVIYTRVTRGGGEVGDMCEMNSNAAFVPADESADSGPAADGDADFHYMVQRSWSNLAAAGGGDPCVPAPPGVYFNAAPRTEAEAIDMNGFTGPVTTEGWALPVGASRTIVFGLYASAPTIEPITVQAIDILAARTGRAPTLQFNFDKTSGYNGDKVSLTVTALAPSSSRSGVTSFQVKSTLKTAGENGGDRSHSWLGVIQAQ